MNQDQNSSTDGWGYCDKRCKGELLLPNNSHNIALKQDTNIWQEDLYDLRMFGAGYCYTYNPPRNSSIDFAKRMFMLLGNKGDSDNSVYS